MVNITWKLTSKYAASELMGQNSFFFFDRVVKIVELGKSTTKSSGEIQLSPNATPKIQEPKFQHPITLFLRILVFPIRPNIYQLENQLPPSLSFSFPSSMAFRADSPRVAANFPP